MGTIKFYFDLPLACNLFLIFSEFKILVLLNCGNYT